MQQFENNNVEEYQATQKRVEHPPENYSLHEIYSIRKESTNHSNELLFKKLNKSFNRIKKLRF